MADFLIHDPGDAGSVNSFFYRLNDSEPWQGAERLPSGGDRLFGAELKTGVLSVGEVMDVFTVTGGTLDAQKANKGVTVSGGSATIGKIIGTARATDNGVLTASSVDGGVSASDDGAVTAGLVEGDVSVRDNAAVKIGGRILGSVSMVGGELQAGSIVVPKQDDLPGSAIGIGGDAELTAKSLTYNGTDAFDKGTKGELRVSHSGNTTIISGDVTGDAIADFTIALAGKIPLASFGTSDFLL